MLWLRSLDYSLASTRSHIYQILWPETNERGVIQFWNQSSGLCLEIIVVVTASYSLFYDPGLYIIYSIPGQILLITYPYLFISIYFILRSPLSQLNHGLSRRKEIIPGGLGRIILERGKHHLSDRERETWIVLQSEGNICRKDNGKHLLPKIIFYFEFFIV